jgi:hypothetical protein
MEGGTAHLEPGDVMKTRWALLVIVLCQLWLGAAVVVLMCIDTGALWVMAHVEGTDVLLSRRALVFWTGYPLGAAWLLFLARQLRELRRRWAALYATPPA